MTTQELAPFALEDLGAELELHFIADYLESHGYTWETVRKLPQAECKQILAAASTYACTRLAEVEDRAELVRTLRGVPRSMFR